MIARVAASAALLGITAGCTEAGGAPQLVVQYAPTDFHGTQSVEEAQWFWTHPPGEVSGGYALETRIAPESFSVLRISRFNEQSFLYRFAPDAPELTDFEFRVRALPDDGSRTSNVVSIRHGLRPPILSCATEGGFDCAFANGGFQLSWTNPSACDASRVLKGTEDRRRDARKRERSLAVAGSAEDRRVDERRAICVSVEKVTSSARPYFP